MQNSEMKIEITCDRTYTNLSKIIEKKLTHSKNLSKRLMRECLIKVNGEVYENRMLRKGDKLEIFFPAETEAIEPLAGSLDILYEDPDLLIINKPQNIAVHSSHLKPTIANWIKYYYSQKNIAQKIRFLNRLDFGTTGILIVAKNFYAHSYLASEMEAGNTEKIYRCIVEGKIKDVQGTISLKLSENPNEMHRYYVTEEGKEAYTDYRVLKRNEKFTYLEVIIRTGRTHQIRVHMSAIGHPILGDGLYGKEGDYLSLHAVQYSLVTPREKRQVRVLAPIPEDFKKLLKYTGLDED